MHKQGRREMGVDYMLVNCCYRSRIKDVKMVPGEEVVRQHHLSVMDSLLKTKGEAVEKV